MANIILVDAGFTHCGWAIIDLSDDSVLACGCIVTEKAKKKKDLRVANDDAERCQVIARGLKAAIDLYQARAMICELPTSGGQGARPLACMARASAIVATLVELIKMPAEWVTPNDVKNVTGKRTATKEEVEKIVLRRWPNVVMPTNLTDRSHVTDALACFLVAENSNIVRTLRAVG